MATEPSPGDLPDKGIEPRSPTLQADSLPAEPPAKSSLFYFSFHLPAKLSQVEEVPFPDDGTLLK